VDISQQTSPATQKARMPKDILAALLAGLVEVVHVELSYEAREVAVLEVSWQDVFREVWHVVDGEPHPIRGPRYSGGVAGVVDDLVGLVKERSQLLMDFRLAHIYNQTFGDWTRENPCPSEVREKQGKPLHFDE